MPDELVSSVLLPLIRGGALEVGVPIDAEELAALCDAPPDDARIAEARHAVAAEILLEPPALPLDPPAVRLAVALYDAIFLTHPDARRHRKSLRNRVAGFAAECAALPPPAPADRKTLLARHTIVHNLFRIARTDRRVHFWVGRREYRGQEPPRRLLWWSGLRRVHVETVRLNWYRQAGVPTAARTVVRRILEASPLTDLLNPVRLDPPLDLFTGAGYFADREIARAVAYEYLRMGLHAVSAPLGAALLRLGAEHAGSPEVKLAIAFVCHLHVLEAMSEGEGAAWLQAEASPPRSAESQEFLAAFAAAFRAGLLPPGVELAPGLAARLARRADLCERLAGAARVEAASAQIAC